MPRTFTVLLRPGEDGWFVVEVPELVGCITQGRTREEALANAREAIELCLEDEEEPRTGVEIAQVAC